MATRRERETHTEYQAAVLDKMMQEKWNKECADCGSKGPRWVSISIGCFLCMRCSGIHRNLGTHISKVRSVSLDKWSKEQIDSFAELGNKKVNKYYEAKLPDDYRRPSGSDDYGIEQFIRQKYEKKRWIGNKSPNMLKKSSEGKVEKGSNSVSIPQQQQQTGTLQPPPQYQQQQHQQQQQQQQQQQVKVGDMLFQPHISSQPVVQNHQQNQQLPSYLSAGVPQNQQQQQHTQQQQQPGLSKETLLSLYATPMTPQHPMNNTGYHGAPNYNVHLPVNQQAQQALYQQQLLQQQQQQMLQQQQQQQFNFNNMYGQQQQQQQQPQQFNLNNLYGQQQQPQQQQPLNLNNMYAQQSNMQYQPQQQQMWMK